MKRILILFVVLGIGISISAQEMYHRVRIDIKDKDLGTLEKIGVEVDHGHLALGRYLENDFSTAEIKQINSAGFSTEIIIEDMVSYYREQMAAGLDRIYTGCDEGFIFENVKTPENFSLGSMGGFYTYEEMLAILDDMQAKYPDLITVKKQIGDILTHENREIFAVEISDNPGVDEGEPASLYTAIHHAREPNGMTSLIYFMWYLLENYDNDEFVKEILDNTSLHFIPCINPDGYVYNQTQQPNGGALWRKNRRNNGDGSFGVDLNRNYGFEWGIDDIGSSSNPNSNTYRGPEPFSEPETQAVKLYCEENEFTMALNFHTYGNLLIHPWGFNDSPTPEDLFFKEVAKEMVKHNEYVYGTGSETVGYVVNGDSDDWMYGEEGTKNKIYAMTPEVGPEGFWPPIDRIIFNCQANVRGNLVNAAVLLSYPYFEETEIELEDEFQGEISVTVRELGFNSESWISRYKVLSGNATLDKESDEYTLGQLGTITLETGFDISSDIELGDEVVIAVEIEGNESIMSDTLRLTYLFGSTSETFIKDEIGEGIVWGADGEEWFYGNDESVSPEYSLTESPFLPYEANTNKSISSVPMTLPASTDLTVTFDLKVNIENDYDFAVLYIEEEGQERIPLCGKFSDQPNNSQPIGEPVYDGNFGWVKEVIDITPWAEKNVKFILRFGSDGFQEGEGIYIDDFEIFSLKSVISTTSTAISEFTVYPNPAYERITLGLPYQQIKNTRIYDTVGQLILTSGSGISEIDISSIANGNYFVVVEDVESQFYRANVVVAK